MAAKRLTAPWVLTIDDDLYQRLSRHLFPGDGDEHGAVLSAGIVHTNRGTRLLARDLFIAKDGVDYVPGTHGYRALTARFVAECVGLCADQGLCYLAVHCHGGADSVRFSSDDLDSHERGYPALLDINRGVPVGALVLATNAIAGDIWTRRGRVTLEATRVIGTRVRDLFPSPPRHAKGSDPIYDRHTRLFGDKGQQILGRLKVGIIGLGGGGSLINEWLARLGVGHIVAIDPDRIEASNLPRVVGARRRDVAPFGAVVSRTASLDRRFSKSKVGIAKRVAREARSRIQFDAVEGDILNEPTARLLTDADFLFLATDTIQSRLVFNALVHQYLIPGIQVGAKVAASDGAIGDIFVATRPVIPGKACLDCYGLIPPGRLRVEALDPEERTRQRYVEDDSVVEPSVITLNVLSAGQAVNDFLMMFTGLFKQGVKLNHHLGFVRERSVQIVDEVLPRESCLDCGNTPRSRRARGDQVRLPCRVADKDSPKATLP